jgi:hypothetical protein
MLQLCFELMECAMHPDDLCIAPLVLRAVNRLVVTRFGTSTSRSWTGSVHVVCRQWSHPCCGAMKSLLTCCRCV